MEYARYFREQGEPFAAGFFEAEGQEPLYRYANAWYRFLEACPLPAYHGEPLYPVGHKFGGAEYGVFPSYSYTFDTNDIQLTAHGITGEAREVIRREMQKMPFPATPHAVGGFCYTHSMPNYQRVEQEGLDAYEARVQALPEGTFRAAMLRLLAGIRLYHRRCRDKLAAEQAPKALQQALERVPFAPAATLYEALVCRNFIYYMDGCDNIGRLDSDWESLYRGENVEPVLETLFDNVDINGGWSGALGPSYSPLTVQVLHVIKGRRRPQIELRVTPDMPQEVWQAAGEALKSGCGHPAFYNEPLYQEALAQTFPAAAPEDLRRFCGGGCTETMFEGITRAGSLDAGINTALVFSDVLRRELPLCADYADFYRRYIEALRQTVDDTLELVAHAYRERAKWVPQPMRTLLIDDCIDRQTEYNAGGARLTYGIVNFAGMINVADSLLAVKELVYERHLYTPQAFLQALDGGDEVFCRDLRQAPRYGNDDAAADRVAAGFVRDAFALLQGKKPPFGLCYLPSSIQFVTYTDAGRAIPATPDGRAAGAPLCDSVGALEGKAVDGPTALLCSAARLPLREAAGTPVLNFRIRKSEVDTALQPLVQTFFRQGGMQMQVNCFSREEVEDAMVHPERHETLIVRTAGYAEYFNRLSPEMKQAVLSRREF